MIEDGGGTVHLREDNCGHPLKIKETTIDHFQHIESSGANGRDKFVSLHREKEATAGLSSFTFDVCPSNNPFEKKTSKDCQSFPSIQVDEVQMIFVSIKFCTLLNCCFFFPIYSNNVIYIEKSMPGH